MTTATPSGDSSALPKATQAVHQNPQLFALVYENVTDAIFLLSVESPEVFRFLSVNPAFSRITGVTFEEIAGRDVRDVIPEPSLQVVLENYRLAIREKRTVRWAETSEYRTGKKYGEVSATPIMSADGRCLNMLGVVRDVTDRMVADLQRVRLAQTLEVTSDFVCLADARTRRLLYLNSAGRKLSGIAKDADVTEIDAYTRYPEEVQKRIATELIPAVAARGIWQGELQILAASGGAVPVLSVAIGHKSGTGELEVISTISRDIRDRLAAEAELEERVASRTQELKAANHELESFSYSVSHDLRAPLRHINGYLNMLSRELDGQLSPKAKRYLDVISSSSKEMGQLIDDLLAFSRIGRAEMEQRVCSLNGLVRASLRELDSVTQGRAIDWVISPLPDVTGDAAMLKLVFRNLLDNAVKFTRHRERARIEIGTSGTRDGRVVVFVRDNGAGFDPQYTHKLFGVFQRLHRADEFEGTGIGLANVQRIIARHGGQVWGEGAIEQGATFYFTVQPAPAAHASSTETRV